MIYPINHLPDVIRVGVQTEQGVEVIGFDLKPWLDVFPDMKFTVWPTRPGESEAYPAKDQMMVGTVLYWHPDGYDTEIAGQGLVEIAGVCEDLRKASGFVQTSIRATSLGKTKEPGENVPPWYEAILKAAEEVKQGGDMFLCTVKDWYSDKSQEDIRTAVTGGKACFLRHHGGKLFLFSGEENGMPTFVRPLRYEWGKGLKEEFCRVDANGRASVYYNDPAKTPNPSKLTIKHGDTSTEYDGSSTVTVEIPQGGGGSTSKEVTILSATELTVADEESGTYALLTPFATKPAVGMLCTVAYNGVEYQCPAVGLDKGQGVAIALGNNALVGQGGGNAEAPFLLLCDPDGTEGMYAMMMVTDAPSSVTVGITAKVVDEAITAYVDGKVDELRKEIQETPEQTTDVLTVTADMSNLEVSNVSHTYAEIVEAIKAGKMVQMIVNQGEGIASYTVPLVMWQESTGVKYLKFQRTLHMGTGIDYENTIVTITYNGGAGGIRAETMAMPYMTREQVVELINQMMGGDTTTDVFYTADGQVFTTVDGAVLHVQKGAE